VPAGTGGAINLYTTNNADMVIDINGYFAPPGNRRAVAVHAIALPGARYAAKPRTAHGNARRECDGERV
jgi:hypothetical protein